MKSFKILGLAFALSAATALSGCNDSEKAGSNPVTLTVVGYVGPFEKVFMETIADPYMKANKNIVIKYRSSRGATEQLAWLRSEKQKPTTNVVVMDASFGNVANREGLFAKLDPKLVPNIQDIDASGRNAEGFGPAFSYDSFAIIYNKKAVPNPPTNWNALWDPKYKGRVVVNESMGLFFVLLLNNLAQGDYQKSIAPGVDLFKKIAPNVQTWAAQPDPYTLVANGTADIGLGYNARSQLYVDQTDGALGVSPPVEGSVLQVNTINLVANSPDAAEAQKFINYALSPEAQKAFASKVYYGPSNTKTQLDPAVKARTAAGMVAPGKIMPVDWLFVTPKTSEWVDIIHRQVVGG